MAGFERRTPISMQSGVAIRLVIRRRVFWQPEILVGPRAQINVFAAHAAKGPKRIAGCVNAGASATGAHHLLDRQGVFFHGLNKYEKRKNGLAR
jgi:hypothetical protein